MSNFNIVQPDAALINEITVNRSDVDTLIANAAGETTGNTLTLATTEGGGATGTFAAAALSAITTIDKDNGTNLITLDIAPAASTVNFFNTPTTVEGTLPAAYAGKAVRTIVGSAIIQDVAGQQACIVEITNTNFKLRKIVAGGFSAGAATLHGISVTYAGP